MLSPSRRWPPTDDVIYDSIPDPRPGNIPSFGLEAESADEVGDYIRFADGSRELDSVTVTMSSWACQGGQWFDGTCLSNAGATFAHDITLNLYHVNSEDPTEVGDLFESVTLEDAAIPFRPSSNPTACGGTHRWEESPGVCYSGKAFEIEFDLNGLMVPDEIIYGVAFNTDGNGFVRSR